MKSLFFVSSVMIVLAAARFAGAYVVENVNWADDVVDYSSAIQNYGGALMDPDTEFWLTGPPDADADGNGYALDPGDPDYVAGWKSTYPDEFFIVHFDVGLADVEDADLNVRFFAGPAASATVLASTDGVDYVQIGVLGGGTPGFFKTESFDFAGLSGVHYVRLQRATSGPQTGLFVDAISGYLTPGDANADGAVDDKDASILGAHWLTGVDHWREGDFNHDGCVNDKDAAILAAHYGTNTETPTGEAPEPAGLILLLGATPVVWLFRRR